MLLIVLAVVGVATFGAVSCCKLSSKRPPGAEGRREYEKCPEKHAWPVYIDEDYKPPAAAEYARPPSYVDCEDLYAQRRVALAAERSLEISCYQAWLSAFGVLGLLATIYLATLSTQAAAASARASADSARHGQRSADTSERALRGLERPYLFIEVVQTSLGYTLDGPPSIRYAIKNYGKLPAVMLSAAISLRHNPAFPLTGPEAIADTSYAVIEAGGRLLSRDGSNDRQLNVAGAEAGQIFRGGAATLLVLYAILEYADPTGAIHTDTFCLRGTEDGRGFRVDERDHDHNSRQSRYSEDAGAS